MPAIAVLTPTTDPRESARAPPELPGFRAASVWITFSTSRLARPSRVASERPSALTTPAVTEPRRLQVGDRAYDRVIGQGIAPDDPELQLAPVDERRGALLGAGHDVGG